MSSSNNKIMSSNGFQQKWMEEERRRRSIVDLKMKEKQTHYDMQEKKGLQFSITEHCMEPHQMDNRDRLRRSRDPKKVQKDVRDEIKYQIKKEEKKSVPRDSSQRWEKEFTKM